VELRELEAFVAVAKDLHFGRAAARLHLGTPTLSDLVRRLERELGAPLFTRTTRKVALTAAGEELLVRAKTILDELETARAAVQRVAAGEGGTVRLGITPPVAPTLAPHLVNAFTARTPHVSVEVQRMWLPNLSAALADGSIDVAITCGLVDEVGGLASEVFCADQLLVGLRPEHRLAGQSSVALADLAYDVLGLAPRELFPAWVIAQRQALALAGTDPPVAPLSDTDLVAARWVEQDEVDWILLISSLAAAHVNSVVRPVEPLQLVPFTLQWNPSRAGTNAVARFVQAVLEMEPPAGWYTQAGHMNHLRDGA
jgi:DNA-binding transcriptional LysR family regulator